MFYSFLRYIIAGLIWLINGRLFWLRRTVRGSIPFF